jgi:hypothetical protein
MGVRAPEGGQSANRDDEATGSKQLRRAFFRHLNPIDVNDDQRGLQGQMSRGQEKMAMAREKMTDKLAERKKNKKDKSQQ